MKHTIVATFALLLFSATDLQAAEIKAVFPAAMKSVMTELISQFERSTGHKINIEYGTVGAIIARLKAGDAMDVAIVTDKQLPDLTKQGLISADGQTVVAKVGLGVFARKGEPIPAIDTVDELKNTLLGDGGLWRAAFAPRSALGLAALLGYGASRP